MGFSTPIAFVLPSFQIAAIYWKSIKTNWLSIDHFHYLFINFAQFGLLGSENECQETGTK